jgi:hypothetical protein
VKRWQDRGRELAWLGLVLLVACNQLTGVDDLEFRDVSQSGMTALPDRCDLLTGGGCNAGQTCRFDVASQSRVCLASPLTSLEPYGLCTADGECPVAHRCLDGVCSKVCDSPAECEGASALCLDEPDSGLGVCTRPCDLVSPEDPRPGLQACGAGARCEFVQNGSYTSCFSPGSSFENGPCQLDRDCPAALLCVAGRCARACAEGGGSCGVGLACSGFAEYAGQNVGSCCAIPLGHACDLVSNCGCATGETCDRNDMEPSACRAVPPSPVAPHARCDLTTQCPAGHSCIGGSCAILCNTNADCGDEGDLCVETYDSSLNLNQGLRVCSRGCDVLSPSTPAEGYRACGADTVCSYYVADSGPTTSCFGAGEVAEGGPCVVERDCAPGLLCGLGRCGKPCEVGGASCGDGAECRRVDEFEGREFGACCTIPEGASCDLVTDCGCAAGEACSITTGAEPVCRPLTNTTDSRVACDDSAETCPGGHSCVKNGCVRNCRVDADCPGVGSACADLFGVTRVGQCSTSCNVVDPFSTEAGYDACGPGLTCSVVTTSDGIDVSSFTHCGVAGTVGEGGACTGFLDCAAGLECYENVCIPSCLVGVGTCPNAATCIVPTPVLIVNGYTLGVCDPT